MRALNPFDMSATAKVEFGDFQTPLVLAREICSLLVQHGIKADSILEPTCGIGAFLVAAAEAFPRARLQVTGPMAQGLAEKFFFDSG